MIGGHTGFSFSHSFENENFKPTKFRFAAGDNVEIEYSPTESRVTFRNLTKKNIDVETLTVANQ